MSGYCRIGDEGVTILDAAMDSAVNKANWEVLEATVDSGVADMVGPKQITELVDIKAAKASKTRPRDNAAENVANDNLGTGQNEDGVTLGWSTFIYPPSSPDHVRTARPARSQRWSLCGTNRIRQKHRSGKAAAGRN